MSPSMIQSIRGEAMRRVSATLSAAMLAMAASVAVAQNRVKTQVVRPQAPPAVTEKDLDPPAITGTVPAIKTPPAPSAAASEIMTDLSQLPAPVTAMRERILAAARSGELSRLVAVMQS